MIGKLGFVNTYKTECYRDGVKNWEEIQHNLVVNEGLDDVLENYFKGTGYTAAHWVGLKQAGAAAASDTLASHATWTEFTGYNGDRKHITFGAVANQSVDNSSSRATFDITASGTVAGVYVATAESGTVGKLFGVVDFGTPRAVASGDSLVITTTFTQASV